MADLQLQQLMNSAGMAIRQSRAALEEVQRMQGGVQRMGADHARMQQEIQRLSQNAADLNNALSRVQVQTQVGDPHIQRVENVPGRRVPFDLLVDIPIRNEDVGTRTGSITISQEGPFVCVSRMATLLSAASFQVQSDQGTARFQARSFGRYRPVHSAWDLNDGRPYSEVTQALAFPGTGQPHIASPSTQSSFRSMQGDFRILFENAGSSYPRSNLEVPSAFWSRQINEPWELGALDFFERSEVLTFKVLPMHPNNPQFGNIQSFAPANNAYPFLDSQYDAVEGINDQVDVEQTTDPVTRTYDAILTIGFHGYRIIQPAGAGPY